MLTAEVSAWGRQLLACLLPCGEAEQSQRHGHLCLAALEGPPCEIGTFATVTYKEDGVQDCPYHPLLCGRHLPEPPISALEDASADNCHVDFQVVKCPVWGLIAKPIWGDKEAMEALRVELNLSRPFLSSMFSPSDQDSAFSCKY